jgi:hypothetical protein
MSEVKRKRTEHRFGRHVRNLLRQAGVRPSDTRSIRERRLRKQLRRGGTWRAVPPTDPVAKCLALVRQELKARRDRSLLWNGKIEMQLKLLIGRAWERSSRTATYVMDKQFGKKGGLDLVALRGSRAKFWIETKCSFFEDFRDGTSSAGKALKQSGPGGGRLTADVKESDVYIVHFLNCVPAGNKHSPPFPQFVLKKYRRLRTGADRLRQRYAISEDLYRRSVLNWLMFLYGKPRKARAKVRTRQMRGVVLSQMPVLEALIVKLT